MAEKQPPIHGLEPEDPFARAREVVQVGVEEDLVVGGDTEVVKEQLAEQERDSPHVSRRWWLIVVLVVGLLLLFAAVLLSAMATAQASLIVGSLAWLWIVMAMFVIALGMLTVYFVVSRTA